jgi:hypothetical protein
MNLIGVMIPASGPRTPVWTPRDRWCCALGRWLVNDLADDVLSEQDRISLVITVRTMRKKPKSGKAPPDRPSRNNPLQGVYRCMT